MLFGSSCKKEKTLSSGGELRFSTDTLSFDTVFTTQGSFTLSVKIYNPQDQKVNISSIRLAGEGNSYFHLNIDGFNGNSHNNIELAAKDSMYVFATVNINPNVDTTPFLIQDQLIATLNGTDYSIPLLAYGQNAYYLVDSVMDQNTTWKTDKPYVIIRSAAVAEGKTLNIPAGCRIYMHADSRLVVLGSLQANGTKKDSIVFQGDRLDRAYFGYEGYPGEWGGIYFGSRSTNNLLNYTILKNCGNSALGAFPAAIQVYIDSTGSSSPQLTLKNTIVENSFGYGLLCFNAHVYAENCLMNSCGTQALALFQGGNYTFNNCTFAVYGDAKINHTDNPTGAILNYYNIDNTHYLSNDLHAVLTNCVIYGSLDNELVCSQKTDNIYDVTLNHCLVRALDTANFVPSFVTKTGTLFNQDPKFVDYTKYDFHADAGSSMIDNGIAIPGLNADLDGNPRPQGAGYDIGCYEK